MKKINKATFVISFLSYIILHWFFDTVIGETPVNILKLSVNSGAFNYLINVLCYVLINITFVEVISVVFRIKGKWDLSIFLGTLISSILNGLIVVIALT